MSPMLLFTDSYGPGGSSPIYSFLLGALVGLLICSILPSPPPGPPCRRATVSLPSEKEIPHFQAQVFDALAGERQSAGGALQLRRQTRQSRDCLKVAGNPQGGSDHEALRDQERQGCPGNNIEHIDQQFLRPGTFRISGSNIP